MICQHVTLSGEAEWPKVADAVIEALKLIGRILQGINIAKASGSQETFHGLSLWRHHPMDFQSIKIPFLAGLRALKILSGVER